MRLEVTNFFSPEFPIADTLLNKQSLVKFRIKVVQGSDANMVK